MDVLMCASLWRSASGIGCESVLSSGPVASTAGRELSGVVRDLSSYSNEELPDRIPPRAM